MTVIAGLETVSGVVIGGDSAATSGAAQSTYAEPKVFRHHQFVIGFSGSFRMGQLLRFDMRLPKLKKSDDLMDYMVRQFVPNIRGLFWKGGSAKRADGGSDTSDKDAIYGDSFDGGILVGVRGRLFCIESDFHVARTDAGYHAIGSGSEVAFGALYALVASNILFDPEDAIRTALGAAAHHTTGVKPPYVLEWSQ